MRVQVVEAPSCEKLADKINASIKNKEVIDIKFQIEQNTYNAYKALIMYK